jgi:hypothetical protein
MAIHSPGREQRRGDPNARVKRYLGYAPAAAAGRSASRELSG